MTAFDNILEYAVEFPRGINFVLILGEPVLWFAEPELH